MAKRGTGTAKLAPAEARGVTLADGNSFLAYFGMGGAETESGVPVTIEAALGVPSIWAAVNFLAGTIAGLPLHVYRRRGSERERANGVLSTLLHDAVNDELSSFDWRKHAMEQVLTGGRSFTFIERNDAGAARFLWPLDPTNMVVERRTEGKTSWKEYRYSDGGRTVRYRADEIIDIPFMLKPDGLGHRGPIMTNRDVIGKAIAATQYGGRFFANGGVPPFAITGGFKTGASMNRAADDLAEAVRKTARDRRHALILPVGLEIKTIGTDAEKAQLLEAQRFAVEEVARIYSMPPTFLQDLTHGTFSNTEQQDLHFVKHTVSRWCNQIEQQMNLKLFGARSNRQFVEFNLDGLLRGDFATRMAGYTAAIQNAIMKPNEARQKENMPNDPAGDQLLIQGATVPLGTSQNPGDPPGDGGPPDGGDDDES